MQYAKIFDRAWHITWRHRVLYQFGILSLFLLALTACGETPESIPTATVLASTEKSSPTPTNTPKPTSTEPSPGELQDFYPYELNMVWWYAVSVEGDLGGLVSTSLVDIDSVKDGIDHLHFETANANSLLDSELIEVTEEDASLLRLTTTFADNSITVDFLPPLNFIKFPLQVGDTWNYSSEPGNQIQYRYEVISNLPVSVFFGELDDCYVVERSSAGEPNFRETFCRDVGRTIIELLLPDGNWQRSELFDITNARVSQGLVEATEQGCTFELSLVGLSQGERFSIQVVEPDGEDILLAEGIEAGTPINYRFEAQAITGQYLFLFSSEQHKAIHIINWSGNCPATE